jgi:hypothetical protein
VSAITGLTHSDLGRAWRELPGWRWMRGMTSLTLADRKHKRWLVSGPDRVAPLGAGAQKHNRAAYPDTTDPATIGCLHALAEEIVGGPVDVEHIGDRVHVSAGPHSWDASASGPTRAHALYALVLEVSRG